MKTLVQKSNSKSSKSGVKVEYSVPVRNSQKYYYYRRPIGDLSKTYWRSIGDPWENNMPDQRPIGARHASLETDMPHWGPTCLIGDRHASLETDMPHQRPKCLIGDQHASLETNKPYQRPMCLIDDPMETDMNHRRLTCQYEDP